MRRGSGSKEHAIEQIRRKGSTRPRFWLGLVEGAPNHPSMEGRVAVQCGDEALVFVDGAPATFHKGATIDGGRFMSVAELQALQLGPAPAKVEPKRERNASTRVKRRRGGAPSVGAKDLLRQALANDDQEVPVDQTVADFAATVGCSAALVLMMVGDGQLEVADGFVVLTSKGLQRLV